MHNKNIYLYGREIYSVLKVCRKYNWFAYTKVEKAKVAFPHCFKLQINYFSKFFFLLD